MATRYGARFADTWRGVNPEHVKADWAEALGRYTNAELERGFEALRERAFPPTLSEFEQDCRPKPDPQAAHAEACRLIGRLEGWSDCSVFWAAREIGTHDLKHLRYADIRGRWIDALERHWRDRKPIPEPEPVAGLLAADAAPKPPPLTEEERAALLERIRTWRPNSINATPRGMGRALSPQEVADLEAKRAAESEIAARGTSTEAA
jgi:hypothetical protein